MKGIFKTAFPFCIAVFSLLAIGCTKNYYNGCTGEGGDNNRITLSSEVQFGTTPRIQDEQIVNGQSLSLFVTREGSTAEGDQLYQNNRITANGMGGFTYRIPMYYPSDGGNVDFYALHPYMSDIVLTTPHSFAVQTDQTNVDNYLMSDLLFGINTGVTPQVNAIPLSFYHRLSKLEFTVTTSDPAIDLNQLTSVSVLGTLAETTISIYTGITTPPTGTAAPILAYLDPDVSSVSATLVKGYTAIIVPQTVTGLQQLFEVVVGGQSLYYTPINDYTFEQGKKYIVNLDVTQSGITVTSQIVNWEDGGSIGGPTGPR